MKKLIRHLLKYLLVIAGFILLFFITFLIIITLKDYQPEEISALDTQNANNRTIDSTNFFDIISWNIGYAGLGKDMDFFYDGGKKVRPSKEEYLKYEKGILNFVAKQSPDFWFFQEVDQKSKRSYKQDQTEKLRKTISDHAFVFSENYKVPFVPVPPSSPMGKVNSGIMLFSQFQSVENERYAYPNIASWPDKLFLLDRCFILSRFKLAGGNDLILMNTHCSYYISEDSLRMIELNIIKAKMLEEYNKGNYVIAGGDWNRFPTDFFSQTTIAKEDLQMSVTPIDLEFLPKDWSWAYDPHYPTNRMLDEAYQTGITEGSVIDFFVVSPNVEVLSCKTFELDFEHADHNPVHLKFELK